MKRMLACLAVTLSAGASADQCWTVSGLKGIGATQGNAYELEEETFKKSVFNVYLSEKSPRIELRDGLGSYSAGEFLAISPLSVAFLALGVVEVISIDPSYGKAYMTVSRSLTPMDKAALFVGKASEGCD